MKPDVDKLCKRIDDFVSNQRLTKAAVAACVTVNPDSPISAAEAVPELVDAAKKLYGLFDLNNGTWPMIEVFFNEDRYWLTVPDETKDALMGFGAALAKVHAEKE